MYLESLNPFIQACMYQKADTINVQLVTVSDICEVKGGFNADAAEWVWKEVSLSAVAYFPNMTIGKWNLTNLRFCQVLRNPPKLSTFCIHIGTSPTTMATTELTFVLGD